ncbi:HmuY family protein [Algibacter sp. PT7-4]|uniref:HmuY family protein n=1 Tax=Algibacter ulvanivorans TaxID=3400999 RepID=UPI003AADEB1C
MKSFKFLSLAILSIIMFSCSDDDAPKLLPVESMQVVNLQAEQTSDYSTNPPTVSGDYVRFSFETGSTTTTDNWDVAFRGTTILVNGGSATADDQPARTGNAEIYITNGSLSGVENVNTSLLKQDDSTNGLAITTGSGNGWYDYNPSNHLISPITGKIIVVKTNNGKYAKFEILSYYKDSDTDKDSQYYTFNYVYNPNEGETTF